ncbi:hypothetical protein JHK82_039893 [Glycine max]|nr:hypothetical protein JHK86_040090 [Glycine max]KAG4965694.1 hypothetical protein JHK85_040669 [Glycine max]KAG5110670.1 hypothetical protein JHK82_039893 [Glycine max]KAG5121960.1 hypothetical protein JHK84_040300 [Glycine max]
MSTNEAELSESKIRSFGKSFRTDLHTSRKIPRFAKAESLDREEVQHPMGTLFEGMCFLTKQEETINPREVQLVGNFTVRLDERWCDCGKIDNLVDFNLAKLGTIVGGLLRSKETIEFVFGLLKNQSDNIIPLRSN